MIVIKLSVAKTTKIKKLKIHLVESETGPIQTGSSDLILMDNIYA